MTVQRAILTATMDLNETAVEKITRPDGSSIMLYQAKHQHFMTGNCLVGKLVDDETFEVCVDDNVILPLHEIGQKVAIGIAPDGTYHEAPDQQPWSERQ